jgi:hypothetical protein
MATVAGFSGLARGQSDCPFIKMEEARFPI